MKLCVAGAAGAFGGKHLEALAAIEGVEVVSVVGGAPDDIAGLAKERRIPHSTKDLGESLARKDVEAVILATPTPNHAQQAIQCLRAGKHVLVEIPMADTLADAEEVVRVQKETGLVAMADHVRRFNPSHQWVHNRIRRGELRVQHLDVQTFFFRRANMNAQGKPRTWTDHLLWAPCLPHRRSVPVSDGRDAIARVRPAGADASDPRHRHGHERRHEGALRGVVHPVLVLQQQGGRSAPSSATSATTAPTSRVTTTSTRATTSRLTLRPSPSPRTGSSSPTASSSRRYGKAVSPTPASRNACQRCARSTGSRSVWLETTERHRG